LEAPWKTFKHDTVKCEQTLFLLVFKIIETLSEVFKPFIPDTAKKIKEQSELKNIGVLFNKIEDQRLSELNEKIRR